MQDYAIFAFFAVSGSGGTLHLAGEPNRPLAARALMAAVRTNWLEGIVAKRRNSSYKPGDRAGAWVKVLANRGQELVIGGHLPASTNLFSRLCCLFEWRRLIYF